MLSRCEPVQLATFCRVSSSSGPVCPVATRLMVKNVRSWFGFYTSESTLKSLTFGFPLTVKSSVGFAPPTVAFCISRCTPQPLKAAQGHLEYLNSAALESISRKFERFSSCGDSDVAVTDFCRLFTGQCIHTERWMERVTYRGLENFVFA